MTAADRAQAAQRLLDDPLVSGLLNDFEADALETMLKAEGEQAMRQCRDTVNTIRAVRSGLRNLITAQQEAARPRPGVA